MKWKAIPGCEGFYEVSDHGQVRSVDRVIQHQDGRMRLYHGQVLAPYSDGNGYPKVTLKKQDAGKRVHVHVLVALAFIGPRPDGLEVCHNDGNPANTARRNLRYDTPAGNHADKALHGTKLMGEQLPWAKLKPEQIFAIKALRGKQSLRKAAAEFDISRAHACNIQRGNRWAHLGN